MGTVFENGYRQDLTERISVRNGGTLMFSGDSLSHEISVALYRNGEAESPEAGTTCVCYVIRPDGGTVTFAGDVSGNTVSAALPQSCFAVPGQIGVALQLVKGTTLTTVFKALYTVERITTGTVVDPGTIIPDVTALTTAIETARASIPSNYSDLLTTIAPTFSNSTAYTAGQYVWYDGDLYRFRVDHAGGNWTGSDAAQVALANDLGEQVGDLKSALSDTNDLMLYISGDSANGNVRGIGYGWRRATNRINSALIAAFGNSITIASSNTNIQYALAKGDGSSNLTVWKTAPYTSTPDQWENGLSLWIQKNDQSDISDSEIAGIMASFTVTYNITNVRSTNFTAHVSPNGSDSADGSVDTPFATVNKALELGYKNILLYGGVYRQTIDLSKTVGTISLEAYDRQIPLFVDPQLVEISVAEQYAEGIYVASITEPVFEDIAWIFQDGVADTATQISYMERLPEQRGHLYRCEDTKIVRCTADNLADAIAEINSASGYKFFADTTNGNLYFSAPSADFATHPICCSSEAAALFENGRPEITAHLVGIEAKYTRINLDNTIGSTAKYCKVSCAYAPTLGQYTWDGAKNVTFFMCEAAMSAGDKAHGDGDGFNAHYAVLISFDTFAHLSGAALINCWSHDNRDDGYSEHQLSESTIIGGLYEYNGKGGITPSYGCHCECIGVVSRYNYNGFVCCNGASRTEGGVGTQLLCIDCTAYGNNGSGTGHGFDCFSSVDEATHNTMVCINCRAYNNLRCGYSIGHNANQIYDYGKLVDCKASNNGVSAYRAYGTIEIINNDNVVAT